MGEGKKKSETAPLQRGVPATDGRTSSKCCVESLLATPQIQSTSGAKLIRIRNSSLYNTSTSSIKHDLCRTAPDIFPKERPIRTVRLLLDRHRELVAKSVRHLVEMRVPQNPSQFPS